MCCASPTESTSSSKFFLVFWHFIGWKNKFFHKCSKLPKNRFRTKKIFISDFLQLHGWVGRSDQIWKIPDFFLNPFLTSILTLTHPFRKKIRKEDKKDTTHRAHARDDDSFIWTTCLYLKHHDDPYDNGCLYSWFNRCLTGIDFSKLHSVTLGCPLSINFVSRIIMYSTIHIKAFSDIKMVEK